MLKGIFEKRDENERWNDNLGQGVGQFHVDAHVVRIAQSHQVEIVMHTLQFQPQRHGAPRAFVQGVAHHLRELQQRSLRALGVDVHEREDIVERVHKKVRIDLETQIRELLLEHLLFQFRHAPALPLRSDVQLHGEVNAHQQYHIDKGEDFARSEEHGPRALRVFLRVGAVRFVLSVGASLPLVALCKVARRCLCYGRPRLLIFLQFRSVHGLFVVWGIVENNRADVARM